MLTEKERKWLENRTPVCCELIPPKSFDGKPQSRCPDCKYNLPPGQCSIHHSDYRDAAEFEARVSRCIAENASELDMISNNLQFLDGFKAKSLVWYILREARIAIEEKESGEEREEIDNEDTSLESIMKCSKKAIARAYMCRAYVTVPIGECPDPYCRVRGCKTCGRVTPQAWEEVLNSEREKRA